MWDNYLIYVLIIALAIIFVVIMHLFIVKRRIKHFKEVQDTSINKYFNLVQMLPQTVFETDREGNISFINNYGLEFTSYSKFSIDNGLSLFDLIAEKEHAKLKETMLYVIEGGLKKGQDFILKDAMGKFIPINLFINSHINPMGEIELKGIIIDASDKQKWENKLLAAILETEDKERKRFSEDLHDGLGPLLSTIKLYISQISKGGIPEEENKKLLNYTNDLLMEAIETARNISNSILPGAIEDNGLIPALNDFFERIRNISDNNIIFKNKVVRPIPKNLEKTLYKIIYELINNTIKHSDSKVIRISLTFDDSLELEYSDDGKGFDIHSIKHGLGLNSIENRSKSLNGDYQIKSSPGEGMKYKLKLNV